MDQRDHAHQAESAGHAHFILRFRLHGAAVRWIYASARMDLGFSQVHELLYGANLLLSVLIYLWLRKKGVARFSAL